MTVDNRVQEWIGNVHTPLFLVHGVSARSSKQSGLRAALEVVKVYTQRAPMVASYPGLLVPALVACSTNAKEGLVKRSHVV